jgi:hypothetical protein
MSLLHFAECTPASARRTKITFVTALGREFPEDLLAVTYTIPILGWIKPRRHIDAAGLLKVIILKIADGLGVF